MHPSAMTMEKKTHRRLGRTQKYFRVPLGVNFRQQHLQRAMNTTLRRMKVRMAAMEMEIKMKRMKNCLEKKREELREMEARFPHLMEENMHALEENLHAREESLWTQVCSDIVDALLSAEAIGDFARAVELRAFLWLLIT